MMAQEESAKHSDAFEFYYLLGDDRSLEKVHKAWTHEGQSYAFKTIRNWSARFKWRDRIKERDREISEGVAKMTVKDIAVAKTETLVDVEKLIEIVKAAIGMGVGELKSGVLKIRTAQDLDYATKAYERLIKLALLLRGEDIEKSDQPLVQLIGFDFSQFPKPSIPIPKPPDGVDMQSFIDADFEVVKGEEKNA